MLHSIKLRSRDSPGKVQMEETFRWAIDNNVKFYDLLGNPSTYKADWSNIDLALASRMRPLTVRGMVYSRLWTTFLKPMVKRTFYWMSTEHRKRLLAVIFGLRTKRAGTVTAQPDSR